MYVFYHVFIDTTRLCTITNCFPHFLPNLIADCACGPDCKCPSDCGGSCCPCTCQGCDGSSCNCGDKCKCTKGCCAAAKCTKCSKSLLMSVFAHVCPVTYCFCHFLADCACGPDCKCPSDCGGKCCPCTCQGCDGSSCKCGDKCKCTKGCCAAAKCTRCSKSFHMSVFAHVCPVTYCFCHFLPE